MNYFGVRMNTFVTLIVSLCLIHAIASGCASTKKDIIAEASEQPIIQDVKIKEFMLSPGDEISIMVYRNEDLSMKTRIPPDGVISYPLIGEFQAGGKSLKEMRSQLTAGLSKYLVNPQVEVSVVSSGGQKYFILGEVHKPGVFTADGNTTIIEAISYAGGMTKDAKEEILVVKGGLEKPDMHLIDIENILEGKDLASNFILQKGDIVYVPSSRIANVERFFLHFSNIISPIVKMETGIVLAPQVEDALKGESTGRTPIGVQP